MEDNKLFDIELENYKKATNITLDGNNKNLHPSNLQPHILGALIDNNWEHKFYDKECKIDNSFIDGDFTDVVYDNHEDGVVLDFNKSNFTYNFYCCLNISGWKQDKEPLEGSQYGNLTTEEYLKECDKIVKLYFTPEKKNIKQTYDENISILDNVFVAKKMFKNIIKYINKYKIKLTKIQKKSLKELIKIWNNVINLTKYEYFDIKKHHTYINGQINDPILDKLWIEYILLNSHIRLMMTEHMNCNCHHTPIEQNNRDWCNSCDRPDLSCRCGVGSPWY